MFAQGRKRDAARGVPAATTPVAKAYIVGTRLYLTQAQRHAGSSWHMRIAIRHS